MCRACECAGGKNPVWNETFNFNVINENNAEIAIMDDDVGEPTCSRYLGMHACMHAQ